MSFKIRINGLKQTLNLLNYKQKNLTNYRIVFINKMNKAMKEIGAFIVAEAKLRLYEGGGGLDTGTMRSRVDFKTEKWNHMELGIYEDSDHPPTVNVSKFTGKVRSSSDRYASYVHRYHPVVKGFLQQEVNKYAKVMVEEAVTKFNDDFSRKFNSK